jgi:2-aminoadipate transaminase
MTVTTPGGEPGWPYPVSERARHLQRSVMRELIAVTARPDIISFAGGLPAAELFPVEELQACLDEVLTRDGRRALQYGPSHGPLREALAAQMAALGVTACADDIFVTNGAQQGLDLVARLLVDPGRAVVVEEIAFTGIAQAFRGQGASFRTVATDTAGGTGMDVAAAAEALPGAAALVAVPAFHNPLGVTLSAEKRAELVARARAARVPIVEDDPYGPLRYEGDDVPALKALDEPGARGGVIYLGSFSKILAPGLRLGWIVAPPPIRGQLTVLKETSDLETSALIQRAVAEFLQRGLLEPHLARLRRAYRERRDAMLAALAAAFPSGAHWTRPAGGIFLWLTLPAEVDTQALLLQAVEQEQVAFIPGRAFSISGSAGRSAMRLNFSNAAPELIAEGVRRLARLLAARLPAGGRG